MTPKTTPTPAAPGMQPWVVYAITLEGVNKTFFGCCKDAQKRFWTLRRELVLNRGNTPKYLQQEFATLHKTADDIHFWVIKDGLEGPAAYRMVSNLVTKYRTYDLSRGWNKRCEPTNRVMERVHQGLPPTLSGD